MKGAIYPLSWSGPTPWKELGIQELLRRCMNSYLKITIWEYGAMPLLPRTILLFPTVVKETKIATDRGIEYIVVRMPVWKTSVSLYPPSNITTMQPWVTLWNNITLFTKWALFPYFFKRLLLESKSKSK